MIDQFQPGFRLLDGSDVNALVDAVNNLTGAGTAGDVVAGTFALNNVETGITAFATGGQASATPLTGAVNIVTVVATAADSVKLPAPEYAGQIVVVVNADAAESMQVFGAGTDTINGVATATGVAQAAGSKALYVAATIGAAAAWWRILSA